MRGLRPEIRNPVLALPAAQDIANLPMEARRALCRLLVDLRRDARERAKHAWRRNKAPMAAYWKAVAVYAGHIERVARSARTD